MWQPLRSADAASTAVNELLAGNTSAALTDARTAVDTDPVSATALWELSEIDTARGDLAAARADLVRATIRQPSNPETWQRLGEFDLRYQHPRLQSPSSSKSIGARPDRGSATLGSRRGLQPHYTIRATARARARGGDSRAPAARPRRHSQQLGEFDLMAGAAQAAVVELQTAVALGAPPPAAKLLAEGQAAVQRTASATSSRRKNGGPPVARTLISPKPNSSSSVRNEARVYRCR